MRRRKTPLVTFAQLEALLTYARVEGKNWRNTLRHSWRTGFYGEKHKEYAVYLEQIRDIELPAFKDKSHGIQRRTTDKD
jgi:hypothetical protein